jgi:hypothetical protein
MSTQIRSIFWAVIAILAMGLMMAKNQTRTLEAKLQGAVPVTPMAASAPAEQPAVAPAAASSEQSPSPESKPNH